MRKLPLLNLLATLFLPLMLSACGANDNDPGPGGVTVGEARALDEAAAMVEDRQLDKATRQKSTAAAKAKPETP